jgi:hypothetical protein
MMVTMPVFLKKLPQKKRLHRLLRMKLLSKKLSKLSAWLSP